MIWNFAINAAGAQATLQQLRSHFDGMFSEMSSGITKNITKFNAYQVALDYCIDAGKQLVKESRELIAISTKYDIPIQKMGSLQMMSAQTGQSIGQLARGFRFLEMNMGRALLKPGGPQYQAFKELGISQEEMVHASEDTMYALDLVRSKVMTIGDEERRNAFLQEIFGANWQNVLPIIEQSATAQKDAATAGYEYSHSMTESLSGVATTMEEIAQDVKPIIMPIVQVVAMLVTLLGVLIEGLKISIQLVGKTLLAAFQAIVGVVQGIIGGIMKVIQGLQWAVTLGNYGKKGGVMDNLGSGFLSASGDSFKGAGKQFVEMSPILKKGNNEVWKSYDRLNRQTHALGESLGMTEEDSYIKERVKDLDATEKALKRNTAENERLSKSYQRSYAMMVAGQLSSEDLKEEEKKLNEVGRERLDLLEKQKELKIELDRAGYQKKINPNDATKPRTAEERKVEIQRNKQEREQGIKEYMAKTPLVAEMETYHEMVKAQMELKKLEEDKADLIKNNSLSIQAEADINNQIANQKIAIIEKEKAHKAFLLKKDRELNDSEKERKDEMIKAMQEREQQFMTRQGMTGMDKQAEVVSKAVDQMRRDEEQLNKVMNDPMRTQSEKLSAKKKLEGSTMTAMKEFDKLSLMQFQYSASDAAKKGMGGGIDIRENQLSVSKEQLDYLRKSYELQLKEFGLNPDQFGNVPFQMQGPMRGGK